jgi:hypothetical protein
MQPGMMNIPAGRRRKWLSSVVPAGIGLLLLALLTSCATTFPVRTDFDRQADFSGYRTFTWISDNPLIVPDGGNPEISPLTRSRIVTAIENELERKGYVKAARGQNADFAVGFTVGTRDRIDIDSYPSAYRGSWYWRHSFWYYDVRTWHYQEGMLAIDVFDQATHRPVWHGFTSKRITSGDRENPAPVIREAVAAILAKFPPR